MFRITIHRDIAIPKDFITIPICILADEIVKTINHLIKLFELKDDKYVLMDENGFYTFIYIEGKDGHNYRIDISLK